MKHNTILIKDTNAAWTTVIEEILTIESQYINIDKDNNFTSIFEQKQTKSTQLTEIALERFILNI